MYILDVLVKRTLHPNVLFYLTNVPRRKCTFSSLNAVLLALILV